MQPLRRTENVSNDVPCLQGDPEGPESVCHSEANSTLLGINMVLARKTPQESRLECQYLFANILDIECSREPPSLGPALSNADDLANLGRHH